MDSIMNFFNTNIGEHTILALFILFTQFIFTQYSKFWFQKKFENYKFNNELKKQQASLIAELFSNIRDYKQKEDETKKNIINKQIWELTLWLPTDILNDLYKVISDKDNSSVEYQEILIRIRKKINPSEKELDFNRIVDLK